MSTFPVSDVPLKTKKEYKSTGKKWKTLRPRIAINNSRKKNDTYGGRYYPRKSKLLQYGDRFLKEIWQKKGAGCVGCINKPIGHKRSGKTLQKTLQLTHLEIIFLKQSNCVLNLRGSWSFRML